MMGGMNEYSLPSGFVTVDHIQQIKIFKERELIISGTVQEIEEFCALAKQPCKDNENSLIDQTLDLEQTFKM